MTTFDDFATTAQNMFDNACKATGEFVNESKLKIERMNLKAELDRCYQKLGKLDYAMIKNGNGDSSAKNEVILAIDDLLSRIHDLTEQINKEK